MDRFIVETLKVMPSPNDKNDWGVVEGVVRLENVVFTISNTCPQDILNFDLDQLDPKSSRFHIISTILDHLERGEDYHNPYLFLKVDWFKTLNMNCPDEGLDDIYSRSDIKVMQLAVHTNDLLNRLSRESIGDLLVQSVYYDTENSYPLPIVEGILCLTDGAHDSPDFILNHGG